MNSRKAIIFSFKGFTLIEIIATIMAAAVLSALFIQFMGTALKWISSLVVKWMSS